MTEFSHAERGMTRFLLNIAQLRVACESMTMWLIARRNEIELRFPLNEKDRVHLAGLLLGDLMPPSPT